MKLLIHSLLKTFAAASIILLCFNLISCSKSTFEEEGDFNEGRTYSGIQEGRSWTYQYDTIAYSGTERDTLTGLLKYIVQDDPTINNGDTSYQVIQYWSPNDSTSFILTRVEHFKVEKGRLVVSQDGLNFIKLVFPINQNTSWLGNSLFDTSEDITEVVGAEIVTTFNAGFEWRYHVDSIGFQIQVGEFSFDNAIAINLVEHVTSVSERTVNEIYAENVGLVSKNMVILNRPMRTEEELIDDANKGFVLNMALTHFE